MGFWNWLGIVGGLAMAIHELHPLWSTRHKRNKEWWAGLFWGFIGLAVAASSLIGGLQSAADATRLTGQINSVQIAADTANGNVRRLEKDLADAEQKEAAEETKVHNRGHLYTQAAVVDRLAWRLRTLYPKKIGIVCVNASNETPRLR